MKKPLHKVHLPKVRRDWGLVWTIGLWLLPLGLLVLLALLPMHPRLSSDNRWRLEQLYELVMGEDGLVEWGQFVLLLASAYGVARHCLAGRGRLRLLGKRVGVSTRLVALIAALGFLVLAGEEISWGQRVFGLHTPAALERINDQGELNVHNLHGLRIIMNGIMLAGSTLLLCLSVWRTSRVPSKLAPAFLVTTAYWVSRLFTQGYHSAFVVRNGEWAEFSMTLGLCVLVYHWVPRRPYAFQDKDLKQQAPEHLAKSA